MYIAPHSREERREVLLRAIHDIHFGVLVVSSIGALEASHLPMLVREEAEGEIVLEGHVSRANPLWKLCDQTPALAIFQGPQAYIHPGWYPTKKLDGRAVPTWNYIAVHVHGALSAVEDGSWLARHLQELTARNEDHRPEPWSISDAPADFIGSLMKGIVGLRLKVRRIEGNWKMAQKQPLENRIGAAQGLAASASEGDQEVGAIVARLAGTNVR
jgi:transcriptional regulator